MQPCLSIGACFFDKRGVQCARVCFFLMNLSSKNPMSARYTLYRVAHPFRTGRNEKQLDHIRCTCTWITKECLDVYISAAATINLRAFPSPHLNRDGGRRADGSQRPQTLGSLGPPPLRLPRDAPTTDQIPGFGAAHPTLPPASSRRHSLAPRACLPGLVFRSKSYVGGRFYARGGLTSPLVGGFAVP